MKPPQLTGKSRLSAIWGAAQALGGHRATPALVNSAALVFLSYSLAQSTWHFASPSRPDTQASASAPARQGVFELKGLQTANLFGVFRAANRAEVALDTLPRSAINLVLSGVAMRGAASYALISGEGQTETAYGVGEQVAPGVVLESVHADRVVVLRGGVREWLPLKEIGAGLPPGSLSSATSAPAAPGGMVLDRQMVSRLLQRPEFLSQATITPNPGGGFNVGQVQAGSLFERLGLRAGDVIRSVNGQAVNNMEDVMRLYQQFGTATDVSVEVTRSGVPQMLQVTLR